jgi:uncharacterized protein YxjI
MPPATDGSIAGIDLDDDRYTVVQSLIRNKYKALDSAGNVILRGKQKLLKMKEEFPVVDSDGEPVFTVKAGGILDIAGDYTIVDDRTDEPVVTLDKNWTLFVHKWQLRDPDTEEVVAQIASRGKIVSALRSMVSLLQFLPHKYEITDADGNHVGTIAGRLSIRDTYDVTIDDASTVPKEAVVAAAMVIDAIENN